MLKRGINIITTIIILIFLATIGVSLLYLYQKSTQNTNNFYLHTYVQNLMKSATEASILNVLGHNFNNGCPTELKINDKLFNVTCYYHFYLTNCGNCKNCTQINTKDTNGSFLITVKAVSKIPGYPLVESKTTIQNP